MADETGEGVRAAIAQASSLLSTHAKKRLVVSVLGSVALSALEMLGVAAMLPLLQLVAGIDPTTGLLGWLGDAVGVQSVGVLVTSVASFVVLAFAVKSFAGLAFRRWQGKFLAYEQARMSTDLLRKFLKAPFFYYRRHTTSDLLRTVEFTVGIAYSGIMGALNMLSEFASVAALFILLVKASPAAGLSVLLYFGVSSYLIQRLTRRALMGAGAEMVAWAGQGNRLSLQAFGAAKEIKLRQAADLYADLYFVPRLRGGLAVARAAFIGEIPKYVMDVVFITGIALLSAVVFATTPADVALTTLGLFIAAGTRLLPSVVRMLASMNGVRVGRPALQELAEVQRSLDSVIAADPLITPKTSQVPAGDVVVDEVSFSYHDRPDQLVLDGVSITIPAGSSLAVVGPSGSGKAPWST